jgi:predicted nucleotidyltransferase
MTLLPPEVVEAIREVLGHGCDVRVVGATALAFSLPHGISRRTLDVDLIATVQSWVHFQTLVADLAGIGWERDRLVEHRFVNAKTRQALDLVPHIPDEPDAIRWPGSGSEMSSVGLDEMFRAQASELVPGLPVLPPLEALVLLKLAAFRDRRYARDISDFLEALTSYDPGERVYGLLAEHGSLTFEECRARALGEEVGSLGLTEASRTALAEVLGTVVGDPNLLRSVGSRLTETDEEAERRVVAYARLIAAFRAGLRL